MTTQVHPAVTKTKLWLEQVIIAFNFCPFAKKEFVNNSIHYQVCPHTRLEKTLADFAEQLEYLAGHSEVETSLFICSLGFRDFEAYLELLDYANELLLDMGFEGVFQIASFHPDYLFEGENIDDAANFTNRSPLPTLHLIREHSISKVLALYPEPEKIPENNIKLAREKGSHYFEQILRKIHQT